MEPALPRPPSVAYCSRWHDLGAWALGPVSSAKFDPNTEYWTVYELPDAENQIPYALNVDKDGIVWICGTHNDTINRFDPKTETLVEIRLPTASFLHP